MMVGIVCAMGREGKPLSGALEEKEEILLKGRRVHKGRIAGREVVIISSGLGLVLASSATQLLIDHFDIGFILGYGSAGAINPKRNIGDIILGNKVITYSEEGAGPKPIKIIPPNSPYPPFRKRGDLKKGGVLGNKELIHAFLAAGRVLGMDDRVFAGTIISCNRNINSRKLKDTIWKKYKAECAEWEGAAVAQIASLHNLPHLVIRGVTDSSSGWFRLEFYRNLKKVSRDLARLIIQCLVGSV